MLLDDRIKTFGIKFYPVKNLKKAVICNETVIQSKSVLLDYIFKIDKQLVFLRNSRYNREMRLET